jgi:hypothetical protein
MDGQEPPEANIFEKPGQSSFTWLGKDERLSFPVELIGNSHFKHLKK